MLKEIRYSVLLVSSNEKLNSAVTKCLSECSCDVKDTVSSIPLAKRLLFERNYDIVIINAPVVDDQGLDFAVSITENENLGIVYLVKSEIYNEIYDKTHQYGIITLSRPTPLSLFEQSMKVLISSKMKLERLKETKTSTVSLKNKMEELKLIAEAKVLLMKHKKVNEDGAHRYLEKMAMDLRITKRKAAESVIAVYKK